MTAVLQPQPHPATTKTVALRPQFFPIIMKTVIPPLQSRLTTTTAAVLLSPALSNDDGGGGPTGDCLQVR